LQQRLVDSRPGKDFAYLGGGERQVAGVQRQDVEGGLELASRATSSLAAVEQAVHEAGRTAERVAGGTASMRDASTQVADNVAGVSSVVEQNAAAAGEMQATTGAVTHAVASVAAAAEQQSSAAEEVSASAAELAAQTNEIALTARHVRAQAEALEALVSRFTLDDQTRAAVDGQRPCAAQSVQ
jgi:methyl-accepting chemotaxis protein